MAFFGGHFESLNSSMLRPSIESFGRHLNVIYRSSLLGFSKVLWWPFEVLNIRPYEVSCRCPLRPSVGSLFGS